jgi:hypothetical protein
LANGHGAVGKGGVAQKKFAVGAKKQPLRAMGLMII